MPLILPCLKSFFLVEAYFTSLIYNAYEYFFASFAIFFFALYFLTFPFSFLHWLVQSYLFLSYWMIIFYVLKKLFVFIEIVLPMPVKFK